MSKTLVPLVFSSIFTSMSTPILNHCYKPQHGYRVLRSGDLNHSKNSMGSSFLSSHHTIILPPKPKRVSPGIPVSRPADVSSKRNDYIWLIRSPGTWKSIWGSSAVHESST
jgi:hypothetical protein